MAWERCSGRSRWSRIGKEASETLKWMDGGRNREAVLLKDPRQERRELEHTEMEWLGQAK